MHREHTREMPTLGNAHRQRGAGDAERKPSARPRGVGHHRRDVGQHTLRHCRLEFRIGQKLHGLYRPFAPRTARRWGERCLHVDWVAHPWVVRPRADHADDRPDHVQLHPDRPRLSVVGAGRRARAGEGRKEQPLEVGIAVGVKLHGGVEPFNPHAAEIAERKKDAGESVAQFHTFDGGWLATAVVRHDVDVFEDQRPHPAELHAPEANRGLKRGHGVGDELREACRTGQQPGQAADPEHGDDGECGQRGLRLRRQK